MTVIKPVHVGGIDCERERLFDVLRGSRHELIYELNNWLFDYFYSRNLCIKQLPPMDDWTHSIEDETFWSIDLDNWKIWTKSLNIEYK